MTDYEKVIEFFSEHEIAIYGFGPTDYGAEEGTLLWCIKELDDIYNRSKGIVLADRGTMLKNQILNVLCTLINIYEKEDAECEDENCETEPSCFNCRWCNTYTKWCCFSNESIDGRVNACTKWECDPYEKEE